MAEEILKRIFASSGQIFTASPPTIVAPSVLAMVLRLSMAELVSSSSTLYFSSFSPRFKCDFLSASISAVVVLKIMASRIEQSADTPIVKKIARVNVKVIC